MATEQRLIDSDALKKAIMAEPWKEQINAVRLTVDYINIIIDEQPTIESRPVVHGYTAHEVAEILAEAFGDDCACNFNGYDEWLPEMCELLDACPYPVGVACWEQWLKHRKKKMDGGADETV